MKTAIFLGAGASASEGAPLQSNLFQEYFESVQRNPNHGNSNMERDLATFFFSMFNINVDQSAEVLKKIKFPTFEEVLGTLDLADIRNESFRSLSTINIAVNSGKLKRMRLYLTLLMAKAINDNLYTTKKVHSKLVKNIMKTGKINDVFFISTNYDILIDNALANLYPNKLLDYGFDFVNFYEDNGWQKPSESSIPLYKIHGSLNWLYCPTCNNVRLTPKEKGIITLLGEDDYSENKAFCSKCDTVFSPIIIPPTFYKDFTNVFLNITWNRAEQELLNTNHLIFCGYSFPDADMHIKYLIKRIQKNRKNDNIKFTVINNHNGKKQEIINEEKNRYSRYLGSNVNYTQLSFEDFSKNPEDII